MKKTLNTNINLCMDTFRINGGGFLINLYYV